LNSLDPKSPLKAQVFPKAFSYPYSPNWQDHSTTAECEFIEEQVGSPEELAKITGSKAHHVHILLFVILTFRDSPVLKFSGFGNVFLNGMRKLGEYLSPQVSLQVYSWG